MERHFHNLIQVLRTVQCIHHCYRNHRFEFHTDPLIFMNYFVLNLGSNYYGIEYLLSILAKSDTFKLIHSPYTGLFLVESVQISFAGVDCLSIKCFKIMGYCYHVSIMVSFIFNCHLHKMSLKWDAIISISKNHCLSTDLSLTCP